MAEQTNGKEPTEAQIDIVKVYEAHLHELHELLVGEIAAHHNEIQRLIGKYRRDEMKLREELGEELKRLEGEVTN